MGDLLKQPWFWEVGGWIAFVFVAVYSSIGDFKRQLPRWYQAGVLAALLGLLIFSRTLLLFFNREINPDESQLLSQAITLWHYPIYWQSTDGATMGVLSSYFTSIPAYLGFRLDYITLRFTALLCLVLTTIAGYYTIENFFSPRVARLATLHTVAFLSFTRNHDFVHATNEQLSLLFISLAFWQYARLWRRQAWNFSGLFTLSVVCSLVPFAKLQGVPVVLVLISAAVVTLFARKAELSAAFWRALAGLVSGGLFFPFIVILLTYYFNVFDDFLSFYILGNLKYSAGGTLWTYIAQFPEFITRTADFTVYLIPTVVLLMIWVSQNPPLKIRSTKTALLILATLLSSVYAVVKPGNEFLHYLLYLVFPICLLNAWFLHQLTQPMHTVAWTLLVLISAGVTAAVQRTEVPGTSAYVYRAKPFQLRQHHVSLVGQTVQQYAQPRECLVVWGWAPRYNVETQLPQGVCDNHTIRCILGSQEAQRVHRARYMRNIQASRPPVFLDAVGPNSVWLNDRRKQGYENVPDLKAYIDARYQFIGEIDRTRVYIRNDRYKAVISRRTEQPKPVG